MSFESVSESQKISHQQGQTPVHTRKLDGQDKLPETKSGSTEKRGVEKLPKWARAFVKAGALLGAIVCNVVSLALLPLSVTGGILAGVGQHKSSKALTRAGVILNAPGFGAGICLDVLKGNNNTLDLLKTWLRDPKPENLPSFKSTEQK